MTFDEWLQTGEGKQAADSTTLGHALGHVGPEADEYLKNRLRNAFGAGYLAGKAYVKSDIAAILHLRLE